MYVCKCGGRAVQLHIHTHLSLRAVHSFKMFTVQLFISNVFLDFAKRESGISICDMASRTVIFLTNSKH